MKKIILNIFDPNLILKLKKIIIMFDQKTMPFFANNGFLSSLYFCFFSTKFRREHKAVLQGRLKYEQSLNVIKNSSVLLRRNTHRLEKGLIMQPRREVFAEAYIEETISCYQKCLEAKELCAQELKWAFDVITQYFNVIGSSDVIDKAHQLFISLENPINRLEENLSIPYCHEQRVIADISANQLHQLFKQRRSVRWYKNKTVPKSLIYQAVEMAAQAPSACNRQPFKFHIISNKDKAVEIASIPMGTVGFSHNIPLIIAVVGNLSAYPLERDRHVIYIDAGLVSMQLMLALETLGLSSCPINFPDIENVEKKMAKALQLEYHLRPIMLLAVGYADPKGKIPFSQKKSASSLIKDVEAC